MTLTELRYIVELARYRHFGRAAAACHVSQPTLSVAIRKLERELGVALFERRAPAIAVTDIGQRVVEQARKVLDEAEAVRQVARLGRDPLSAPLRLGTIYTIGPYLLPALVRQLLRRAPQMPLLLSENYTVRLLESVRNGQIDVAILALPVPDGGLSMQAVYDEPFVVAVPRRHAWSRRSAIGSGELAGETMLLLGSGHCFRDQVLDVCPELSRGAAAGDGVDETAALQVRNRTFEGSSLETIRQMVASGIGVTVMPRTAIPSRVPRQSLVSYVPFRPPVPVRRVVLAWRRSFTRLAAVETLRRAILDCPLDGVDKLDAAAAAA
jgi:LysR family transcriptional regulator, hydrogen peroxide-inducible genes activator